MAKNEAKVVAVADAVAATTLEVKIREDVDSATVKLARPENWYKVGGVYLVPVFGRVYEIPTGVGDAQLPGCPFSIPMVRDIFRRGLEQIGQWRGKAAPPDQQSTVVLEAYRALLSGAEETTRDRSVVSIGARDRATLAMAARNKAASIKGKDKAATETRAFWDSIASNANADTFALSDVRGLLHHAELQAFLPEEYRKAQDDTLAKLRATFAGAAK